MARKKRPYTPQQVAMILRQLETHWPSGLYLFGGPTTLSLARTMTPAERAAYASTPGNMPVCALANFRIPASGGDPQWLDCSHELAEGEEAPAHD